MDAENEGEENEDGDDRGDAGLRCDGAHERQDHQARDEREEAGERNDKKCEEFAEEHFGAGDSGAKNKGKAIVAAFVREELSAEGSGDDEVDQGGNKNQVVEENADFAGREIEV